MIELLVEYKGHEPGTRHDFGCILNHRLVRAGKAKFIKVADIKMMYK
jgi:hypothetical protein